MKQVDYRVAYPVCTGTSLQSSDAQINQTLSRCIHEDEELVGILTLGWGTNPMGTIKKMFPTLTTQDYYEIGKMCMDDAMPRNSETQMMSATIKWMKQNTPSVSYLYTWADGIVG